MLKLHLSMVSGSSGDGPLSQNHGFGTIDP